MLSNGVAILQDQPWPGVSSVMVISTPIDYSVYQSPSVHERNAQTGRCCVTSSGPDSRRRLLRSISQGSPSSHPCSMMGKHCLSRKIDGPGQRQPLRRTALARLPLQALNCSVRSTKDELFSETRGRCEHQEYQELQQRLGRDIGQGTIVVRPKKVSQHSCQRDHNNHKSDCKP